MSNVDDFLNDRGDECDAVLGTKTMVVGAQSFSVVWNNDRAGLDGIVGGLDDQHSATAVAQPADVTSPLAMRGLRCTVAGDAYRVEDVTVGDVAITFELVGLTE